MLKKSFNITLFNNIVNCWAELCRIDKCRSNGLHFEFMLFSNMDFKLPANCPPWNWPFKQKSSLALEQRCAKLYILSRNRNQYATGSKFRTTKSKPICIAAFFRNQNRNQYLYFEQIRNQNQNQYAWAALFKIKTTTNMIFSKNLIK